MTSFRVGIGARVRQVRGNLSQREFAEILGFSQGFVGDIERGRSFPSIPFMIALNANFDCELNWLLTGESGGRVCRETKTPDGGADSWDCDFGSLLCEMANLFAAADPDTRAWMRIQMQQAIRQTELVTKTRARTEPCHCPPGCSDR